MFAYFSGTMTNQNPWQVDSIQDFWFLRCPECSFDTKEEEHFRVHAIENHPESFQQTSEGRG